MTDAPKRIWVHVIPIGPLNTRVAISDEKESSAQIEYVRADTIAELREELREARELLADSKRIWGCLVGDCQDPEQVAEEEQWAERLDAFLAKTQPKGTDK